LALCGATALASINVQGAEHFLTATDHWSQTVQTNPAGAKVAALGASSQGTVDVNPGGGVLVLDPPMLLGSGGTGGLPHSADQNGDGAISLSELLRVIQFYNLPRYGCEAGTEDGYAPNGTDESCVPHASDYNPLDWRIQLTELLRVIQFYNSGAYSPCETGEDGYCPGQAP
jgi:hypothetical protein